MNNINLNNIEEHLRLQNYFYYLAFIENNIKKEIEKEINMKKFSVKSLNEQDWYISDGNGTYIHKDKTFHTSCDKEHRFESKKLANKILNEYLLEENKNEYVLTNKLLISEDILFYSFRYCLGRMTYVVDDCVQHLKLNWNALHPKTQEMIHSEIREAIMKNQAGMECDIREWNKILELKIKE